MFGDIIDTVENGTDAILKEYEEPLFNRCKGIILKACQLTAASATANMSMIILTPIVTTAKYAYSAEFPFVVAETWNYVINMVVQVLGSLYVGLYFGFFSLIFICLTVASLYKLKLVAVLCHIVGEFDENREVKGKKLEPASVSVSSLESSQLLKVIQETHLKAIVMVQDINQIFSVSILCWEGSMILGSCMYYVLSLVDPARLLSFTPACSICLMQYLIVSLLSTFVKDALDDVGTKLYTSHWYSMRPKDCKSMLMILVLAQQSKTLTVWSLADANLERFTDVSPFSLNIS